MRLYDKKYILELIENQKRMLFNPLNSFWQLLDISSNITNLKNLYSKMEKHGYIDFDEIKNNIITIDYL